MRSVARSLRSFSTVPVLNTPHSFATPVANKMASYDSDSSLEDDGEYTATNVLLGYATEESTEEGISQLGGYPVCEARLATIPSSLKCLLIHSAVMARRKDSASGRLSEMQSLQRPNGSHASIEWQPPRSIS